MAKSVNKDKISMDKIFAYKPFKLLDMTLEEKEKWKDICKEIYFKEAECAALPADQCSYSGFYHNYLTRDEQTNEIVLRARMCEKGKLHSNYLIQQFANTKLSLSLLNDEKTFSVQPDEQKINNFLLNSIKTNEIVGFYFFGDVGIGKTHKMISYCNDMIVKNDRTVAYVFLPEMVRQMRENFSSTNNANKELIDKCCAADILILDDFGAEYTSPWFYLNFLLIILNYRCETEKPIIFVSNFNFEKMTKLLESRMKNIEKGAIDKDFQEMMVKRLISRLKQLINNKCATYKTKSRRK